MRLLLDTHVFLWWLADSDRLSHGAHELIEDRVPAFLSAASCWEIAIKWVKGELRLPTPPERYIPERLAEQGISALVVEHGHALRTASLPPIHTDPFDRLLIAQAQMERLQLVTADPQILKYDVETIWASRDEPPRTRRRSRR